MAVTAWAPGLPFVDPPFFRAAPVISPDGGTAQVTTFTASDGSTSNAVATTRRWLLNGKEIGTGPTVLPEEPGELVREVTATGAGGQTKATTSVGVVALVAEPGTLLSPLDRRVLRSPVTGAILLSPRAGRVSQRI